MGSLNLPLMGADNKAPHPLFPDCWTALVSIELVTEEVQPRKVIRYAIVRPREKVPDLTDMELLESDQATESGRGAELKENDLEVCSMMVFLDAARQRFEGRLLEKKILDTLSIVGEKIGGGGASTGVEKWVVTMSDFEALAMLRQVGGGSCTLPITARSNTDVELDRRKEIRDCELW